VPLANTTTLERVGLAERVARLLASSAAATAVDVAVLLVLVGVGRIAPGLAAVLGCLAGGVVGFVLARRFVFEARGRDWLRQVAAYGLLVVLGGALIAGLLVHVATAGMGAPVLLAKAIAACLVLAGWNYPLSAYVVFRKESIG
jgi:putative flippase GtrA